MSAIVNAPTDCLVFKFEEVETDTKNIDTTVYVFFDTNKKKYIIRGKRRSSAKYNSCTYSFDSSSIYEVVNFLQYIICRFNRLNETLYNYDNFPYDSNEITFDFFHTHDHQDYEIAGYDGEKIVRDRLVKNLRMLSSICNEF